EAKRSIDQLAKLEKERKLEPGLFGSIELQAQLWENEGKTTQALELVREFVGRPSAEPERIFILINALARQNRFAEALDWCEKARDQCAPEKLGVITVTLLR